MLHLRPALLVSRLQVGKHSDALRMALKLGSRELAEQAFANCAEPFYKKQVGGAEMKPSTGMRREITWSRNNWVPLSRSPRLWAARQNQTLGRGV